MPRFQGDVLLVGLDELLNFVNLGECDGGVVSLFWPFDDARYKPIHWDVSLSLPNIRARRGGWPQLWPATPQSVHRALRRALHEQLVRMVKGEKPILPTCPGWTRRSVARLSPVEAATVTAVRYAFDDVIASALDGGLCFRSCKTCSLFFAEGHEPGRPSDFCSEEHRGEYRHTGAFKKTQAARARTRRAVEKAKHTLAAEAVARKPRQKPHI